MASRTPYPFGLVAQDAALAAPLPRRRRAAPDDPSPLGVAEALALPADAVPAVGCSVYVPLAPVRVLPRGGRGTGASWDVTGPLLRGRVLDALDPLLAAGWRLGGTFVAAARWDVSADEGPPRYRGCWVWLHRDAPAVDEGGAERPRVPKGSSR